jgi:hypothetical protein
MKQKLIYILILVFFTACERSGDVEKILRYYGDAKEDIGYSIAIADDGYFICGQLTQVTRPTGRMIQSTSKKVGIIKTDFDGMVLWKGYYGGRLQGYGSKIIVLDDGSAVCAGQVTDTVTFQSDIFVVKVNSGGSGAVEKTYKITGNQTSADILKTGEGFIILGTTDVERAPVTDSSGNKMGKKDILLMRINENLEQIDLPSVAGFPNDDYGVSIKNDIEGGYIIAGTSDKPELGLDKNNMFLLRANSDASFGQQSFIGTTDDEYAEDFEVLNDGYLLAGTIGEDGEDQAILISRIPKDINSAPLFTRKIEHEEGSWSVKAISRYRNNSFVLAGKAGSASSAKILIFVIDPEGNPVMDKEKITGSPGQIAYDVISDSEGNVIAIGKNSYPASSLISLLKFRF